MNEEEKIGEDIARTICNASNCEHYNGFRNCKIWGDQLCDLVNAEVDEILSLVRIECSNQDLPLIEYENEPLLGLAARGAQKDMLKVGFIKCLPKKEEQNEY